MSKVERHNNQLLRHSKVVIPHDKLNPFLIPKNVIRYWRAGRIVGFGAPTAYALLGGHPASGALGAAIGLLGFSPFYAQQIIEAYRKINFSQPIFFPQHEKDFPEGWINVKIIQRTHPIYYVDMTGNLIFLKPTRAEYYRYLFQKSILGKLGYNTWWLRGYLEPPKAPESVKKWAREKLREAIARARIRPALRPATVHVQATAQRPARKQKYRRKVR